MIKFLCGLSEDGFFVAASREVPVQPARIAALLGCRCLTRELVRDVFRTSSVINGYI